MIPCKHWYSQLFCTCNTLTHVHVSHICKMQFINQTSITCKTANLSIGINSRKHSVHIQQIKSVLQRRSQC